MTTILLGISAGLAAVVVALIALLVVLTRRASGRAERRASAVAAGLDARMRDLTRALAAAVERTGEEERRARFLGEVSSSLELDDVLARTLEAATALPGADAALLTLRAGDARPLVATLGLSSEEAERQAIVGPPEGPRARSIAISYRYAPEQEGTGPLIHAGLSVPIPGDASEGDASDPEGSLTLFSRSPDHAYTDDTTERLEELARHAAPAIRNARRFGETRRLADLDALTGLHNRRSFHETLAREVARARRYDRTLALAVFDVDDFKEVNDRIGHLAGDAALADVAGRVRDSVRSADLACRIGGDEFAVILPESGVADADELCRRIESAVLSRPIEPGGRITVSAGVAELRRDEDAVRLFERADEALYRAKEHGRGSAVTAAAVGPSDQPSRAPAAGTERRS